MAVVANHQYTLPNNLFELNFYWFETQLGVLTIPDVPNQSIILFRGGTSDITVTPSGKDVPPPRWIGSKYQALHYMGRAEDKSLFVYAFKPGVRLMDLRTMRYLFYSSMFGKDRKIYKHGDVEKAKTACFVLGVPTLKSQMEFLKQNGHILDNAEMNKLFPNVNDFEIGRRYSVDELDNVMAKFISEQEQFQDIDGYIAPALESSKYTNRLFHEEVCLFNPAKSLQRVDVIPANIAHTIRCNSVNINDVIEYVEPINNFQQQKDYSPMVISRGGTPFGHTRRTKSAPKSAPKQVQSQLVYTDAEIAEFEARDRMAVLMAPNKVKSRQKSEGRTKVGVKSL
jgi:hypothetical protein